MSKVDWDLVEDIGNTIRTFRETKYSNLSRMDFYKRISDSEDQIKKIEAGKAMPSFAFLVELSNKYQVPVDYFTKSGFHAKKKNQDAYHILEGMSLKEQYQFMQFVNTTKYLLFTTIPIKELRQIHILENEKSLCGDLLRNARVKSRISLSTLALKIGRAQSTVSRMEAGSGDTSSYIWAKISREFHIPLDSFLVERLSENSINFQIVIDHLIYDTFHGLNKEDRTLMLSVMETLKKNHSRCETL